MNFFDFEYGMATLSPILDIGFNDCKYKNKQPKNRFNLTKSYGLAEAFCFDKNWGI
jgi:hypothetical protein